MIRAKFSGFALQLIWVGVTLGSLALASPSAAEQINCRVFAREAINSTRYKRTRLFVATSNTAPDDILALGYAAALHEAANRGMDFVAVFVTRLSDGTNRNDHTSATTLAIVSFNPGNTSVTKTELEGTVVRAPVTATGELSVMMAPKEDVGQLRIVEAYLGVKERGEKFGCLNKR